MYWNSDMQAGIQKTNGLIVTWDVLKPYRKRSKDSDFAINSNMRCIETIGRDWQGQEIFD